MLTQVAKLIADSCCGYAIPSPTVFSRDSIKWCFQAASDMRGPVIIGVGDASALPLEEAAELTKKFSAMFAQVPSGLSLENCGSFGMAVRAVFAGYSNIVMPVECGEELIRESANLCRATGARLELAINLDSELLSASGELLATANRMQAGGILVRGAAPADAGETYEVGLARKLWALYDETALLTGIQGEIFKNRECLKLAARTGLSRVTFSESLSGAGVRAAVHLVSEPEKDRRGLPKLQAAVCEGFTGELSSHMKVLNAHNRF